MTGYTQQAVTLAVACPPPPPPVPCRPLFSEEASAHKQQGLAVSIDPSLHLLPLCPSPPPPPQLTQQALILAAAAAFGHAATPLSHPPGGPCYQQELTLAAAAAFLSASSSGIRR